MLIVQHDTRLLISMAISVDTVIRFYGFDNICLIYMAYLIQDIEI